MHQGQRKILLESMLQYLKHAAKNNHFYLMQGSTLTLARWPEASKNH